MAEKHWLANQLVEPKPKAAGSPATHETTEARLIHDLGRFPAGSPHVLGGAFQIGGMKVDVDLRRWVLTMRSGLYGWRL